MFPDRLTLDLAPGINAVVDSAVSRYGELFQSLGDGVLAALLAVEQLLRGAPWWLVISGIVAGAYAATRRPLIAVAAGAAMVVVGMFGLWDQAMQTLALTVVAVAASIVIGVPAGVAFARAPRAARFARPVLDAMQTLPSFVYLIPAMMMFGLGKVPALLATVVYALPPLIRLTELGLRQADAAAIEAADAFGATAAQRLWRVELPLALPAIMTGVNQATMMALSMVVVAAMIGARGLGEEVLLGIQRLDVGRGLIAGVVIVLLAVVMDRTTQGIGRRLAGRP
jgi:glycine betaine/proline transport system permease protein